MTVAAGLQAIVMAAGKGTRLKSEHPKVLHALLGKTLLARVLETLTPLFPENVYVVVGHGKEAVKAELTGLKSALSYAITPVTQSVQMGTGYAIQQVKAAARLDGTVLILSGDTPLLRMETLLALTQKHTQAGHDLTLLVAHLENPFGYGRVVVKDGAVVKVVEEKDATPEEKTLHTINTSIYCVNWKAIAPLLDQLTPNNAQGELYLTDVVGLAVRHKLKVGTFELSHSEEALGVNSRQDLARCTQVLNHRTLERLMSEGVSIVDPTNTVIAPEAQVGPDTIVYPGCYMEGAITIGKGCVIGPQTTLLHNVHIKDGAQVICSYVRDSVIGAESLIGPYAHLRDNAQIAGHVKIGNFVEVKNSAINENSFASHLSYVGDAIIGKDVNLGAGTITANFNALTGEKHKTVIEDHAKTGSNSVLVAPVTVGHHGFVAAGSVITKDVPPYALAVTRSKQVEVIDWVKKQLGNS